MNVRLLVVDDQAAVREALMTLMDDAEGIDVVGGAANGVDGARRAVELRAQVVLMDLVMPGADGLWATRQLGGSSPDIAVVVLTTFADQDTALSCRSTGARGLLTKDCGQRQIAAAVHSAASGRTSLDPDAWLVLPNVPDTERPPLTAREQQILPLVAQGLSNAAIARRLAIQRTTVKTHVTHLFAKLGVRSQAKTGRWLALHAPPPAPPRCAAEPDFRATRRGIGC